MISIQESKYAVQNGPPIQCSISLKDDPVERLPFESFPGPISESYSANWSPSTGGRRSAAIRASYKGGNFGGFTLDLVFVAGLHKNMKSPSQAYKVQYDAIADVNAALQEMEKKVRWLQGTMFPKAAIRRTSAMRMKGAPAPGDPPRVLVTYGRFMTFEGVVTRGTIVWGGVTKKFHPVSVRPFDAKVSLSITRLHTFYPDWYDITGVPEKNYTNAVGIIADSASANAKKSAETLKEALLQNPVFGAFIPR